MGLLSTHFTFFGLLFFGEAKKVTSCRATPGKFASAPKYLDHSPYVLGLVKHPATSLDPSVRWNDGADSNRFDEHHCHFNHPRRLKYQNGAMALPIINTNANGYPKS